MCTVFVDICLDLGCLLGFAAASFTINNSVILMHIHAPEILMMNLFYFIATQVVKKWINSLERKTD
jgi:hypothetical protein